jgi:phenylpropionate dioxygenase-like ring-hydroxylating dioxygenase large terminal subunit
MRAAPLARREAERLRPPPASIEQENAFDISHTSFVHHGFFGRREDATPGAPAAPLPRSAAAPSAAASARSLTFLALDI